jgi:hypothetical protein
MTCVAKANLLRCIGCFAFPFVAVGAYAYKVSSTGDSAHSFLARVASGGLPFASAVLVVGGCLVWVGVTWPKARRALRYSGCAISIDDRRFSFYDAQVDRKDIAEVVTLRTPLDLQLRVVRKDGETVTRSIALLNPSPETIMKRLEVAGL